jgi:hypothetical protein
MYALDFIGFETSNAILKDEKKIREIFEDIFSSQVFQVAYGETEALKNTIRVEWEREANRISAFLEGFGIEDKDRCFRVYVVHPSLCIGSYLGGQIIEWGCSPRYSGCALVGLSHELLHGIAEEVLSGDISEERLWITHAFIYLAADEELRCRLSGSASYFHPDLISSYDVRLTRIAKLVEQVWREALKDSTYRLDEMLRRVYADPRISSDVHDAIRQFDGNPTPATEANS